jgi:hypothetical protein
MDTKKDYLKNMSASDLRAELVGRLREQIRKNELENEQLREQIRQLGPVVKVISTNLPDQPRRGRRPGAAGGNGVRTRARNERPLREIIADVLRHAGEPLRVRDIMERSKAMGFVSNANNFASVVALTLSNNENSFERVDRGIYRLRESSAAAEPATASDPMGFGANS